MHEQSRKYRVLFLCTGNSARSILAEFLLRRLDARRFETFSAGATPKGRVNPFVLELLRDGYQIDASAARSKSLTELSAESFDFVITVCDRAREACPVWPGQPIVAHWSFEDPDAAVGDAARRAAVQQAAVQIDRRLRLFAALPIESLDRLKLGDAASAIGRS